MLFQSHKTLLWSWNGTKTKNNYAKTHWVLSGLGVSVYRDLRLHLSVIRCLTPDLATNLTHRYIFKSESSQIWHFFSDFLCCSNANKRNKHVNTKAFVIATQQFSGRKKEVQGCQYCRIMTVCVLLAPIRNLLRRNNGISHRKTPQGQTQTHPCNTPEHHPPPFLCSCQEEHRGTGWEAAA